ncbi:MAG: bis(5'-nucleosyl)-tetraphosphatase (symmetrical) YqeK [Slackia sp.]|nr:bis(5'-nucleosyl)-tetraphosphatase (symmetrical) YqeK [Slackia sp.]
MVDPDTFEEMRRRLEQRVKPSRYRHSMGVSQTAEQLARIYGVDCDAAAVAGLLHDWDKALSFKELRRLAKKHKLAPKSVRKQMPGVLHAVTAPRSLKRAFPGLSPEVLQAIARHTCGAVDMTDLDKVVFIADIIEPGRTFSDVAPLREAVGAVSLDELFFMTYGSTLVYLIEAGLPVHPDSLEVWNALVAQRDERRAQEDLSAKQGGASDACAAPADSARSASAAAPRAPRVIVIE